MPGSRYTSQPPPWPWQMPSCQLSPCRGLQHLLEVQGVLKILCFFPRILDSLPHLTRQHSAAIGCTKKYQPIGVTVHSHCAESFEGLLQRCRRGRGCSELRKNRIFPEHPVPPDPTDLTSAWSLRDNPRQRLLTKTARPKLDLNFLLEIMDEEPELELSILTLNCWGLGLGISKVRSIFLLQQSTNIKVIHLFVNRRNSFTSPSRYY